MSSAGTFGQDKDTMLEEIIVTAQKREEKISDVPVSIVLITDERLERSRIERVLDLQYSTPGFVQTGQENAGWVQISLRGIQTVTVTTGFSLGIGMFIDGVDQGMPYAFNQELVDIERVEVLRGPQPTLFGRNTIAGAFNITTKKPGDELEMYGNVELGNFGLVNFKGSVSGPLTEDLNGRVSFYRRDRDGYVDNVFTGGTVNDQDQIGGRLQFRYEPTQNLTVDVSVDAMVEDRHFAYHEIIADTPGGVDYTGEIPPGLYTISHNFDDTEERDLWGGQVNINYVMDNGYTFTSVSGYRYGLDDIVEDTDHTSRDDQIYRQDKNFDQFTQEFRLASPASTDWNKNYDFMVGTYFMSQDADQVNCFAFGTQSGLIPENSCAPAGLQSLQVAFFGHGNYNLGDFLSDRLSINAGVRVDYERREMEYAEEGFQLAFAFPSTPFFKDDLDEVNFSPAVGLDFKLTDNLLLYGKFSIAFKSGAFDLGVIKGGQGDFSFDSEKVTAFEGGIRGGGLFGGRLNFGLAGYYMDYERLQIEIVIPAPPPLPGIRSRGDAAANIYGVELETVITPFDGLTLEGGFSYNSSKFKDSVPVLGGNYLANAPNWTGYTNATYEFPIASLGTAYVRGEWTYRDSWWSFPANLPTERPDSFDLFNARVGLVLNQGWEIAGWIQNIADNNYCTELWDIVGGFRCGIGRPKTYGVSLSYRYD